MARLSTGGAGHDRFWLAIAVGCGPNPDDLDKGDVYAAPSAGLGARSCCGRAGDGGVYGFVRGSDADLVRGLATDKSNI